MWMVGSPEVKGLVHGAKNHSEETRLPASSGDLGPQRCNKAAQSRSCTHQTGWVTVGGAVEVMTLTRSWGEHVGLSVRTMNKRTFQGFSLCTSVLGR